MSTSTRLNDLERRVRNLTLAIKYGRKYYRQGISHDNGDDIISLLIKREDVKNQAAQAAGIEGSRR